MEATQRFAELMAMPESAVALDEAAMLIAAHAYPGLDVGAGLTTLSDLAERCPKASLEGLIDHLFVDLGFVGNASDYYNPRNSFLNDVVDRRTGIPISLAVLMMSVGARIDVPLEGVGMPGHFLVRAAGEATFIDPFDGGRMLDEPGCKEAFRAVHGADALFDSAYLAPVGTFAILGRMLANLRSTFAATGDRASLEWVLRLRTMIPGLPAEERAELASVLAAGGCFADAAGEYDELANVLGGDLGHEYRCSASRLRARLN